MLNLYQHREERKLPDSSLLISDLKKAYDALVFKDAATQTLSEALGTDIDWKYALEKLKKSGTWEALITAEFGNTKTLDLVIPNYLNFDSEKKWLYFIALKLYGAKNNWCLNNVASEPQA